MSNIHSWSTSAANNNSAAPDGFPEGMAPSGVNDAAREVMAAVKRWYVDAEWRIFDLSAVRQSNTSFLVSVTATNVFTAGRRLRMIDGGVTIYGDVIASGMSGANTLVTVSASALSASLSQISVANLNPAARSDPDVGVLTTTASVTASDYVEIFQSGTGLRRRALVPDAVRGAGLSLQAEVDISTGAASYTLASSIPAWAKRITVMIEAASSSGTSIHRIRIGDSGGVETSGYDSRATIATGGLASTAGFDLYQAAVAAANTYSGVLILTLKDATNHTWSATWNYHRNDGVGSYGVGFKSLNTALTDIQLTTVNGTDTYDAGSASVVIEG
jgi:hypothetical protein